MGVCVISSKPWVFVSSRVSHGCFGKFLEIFTVVPPPPELVMEAAVRACWKGH